LFGDSLIGIYIIGIFTVYFLVFSKYLDFSKVNKYKVELSLWLIFISSLLLSSFFTHSVSLTLKSLIFYVFSFIFFSFFLLIKKKFIKTNLLLINMILVLVMLSTLSFSFLFFPDIAQKIPGMNIVYSTYGHNHLGSMIILLMPLVWYFLQEKYKDKNFSLIFSFILLFLLLNLIIGFGRVVILLGLVQTIILGVINYKILFNRNKYFKLLLLLIIFLLFGSLLLKNSFSFASYFNKEYLCPWSEFENKLCKDIAEDLRVSYWLTALRSIKEHTLVGYGPGSFPLLNEKYMLRPDANTGFAHNGFLQVFAESGIIGGISFISLMGYLLIKVISQVIKYKKIFKIKLNRGFFILTGIISIYLNILFDFDWSFVGVFCSTLLLFTLLLRDKEDWQVSDFFNIRLFKVALLLLSLAVILLSSISLIVDYQISKGNINGAISFFPYFQNHKDKFLSNTDVSLENKEKINNIYYNFSSLYDLESGSYVSDISPWYYYSSLKMKEIYNQDIELARTELLKLDRIYRIARKNGYRGESTINYNLAIISIDIGDYYLKQADLTKSVQMYLVAYHFDEWVLNNTFPSFLYLLNDDSQKIDFWTRMKDIPSKYFGKHSEEVAIAHRPLFKNSLETNDLILMSNELDRMLELNPMAVDDMEFDELIIIQRMANYFIENKDWDSAQIATELLFKIGSYAGKSQLGNYFLLVGDLKRAEESYIACNEDWNLLRDEDHGNCIIGINNIEQIDKNIYFKVSQDILNK